MNKEINEIGEERSKDIVSKRKDNCVACGCPLPMSDYYYKMNGNYCEVCSSMAHKVCVGEMSKEKREEELEKRRRAFLG